MTPVYVDNLQTWKTENEEEKKFVFQIQVQILARGYAVTIAIAWYVSETRQNLHTTSY